MAKVVVTIDPTGKLKYEIQGVKGEGCLNLTAALSENLGPVVDSGVTSEYFENEEEVKLYEKW
jgi:hypothetical protein